MLMTLYTTDAGAGLLADFTGLQGAFSVCAFNCLMDPLSYVSSARLARDSQVQINQDFFCCCRVPLVPAWSNTV